MFFPVAAVAAVAAVAVDVDDITFFFAFFHDASRIDAERREKQTLGRMELMARTYLLRTYSATN